jgi:hypothetical protein
MAFALLPALRAVASGLPSRAPTPSSPVMAATTFKRLSPTPGPTKPMISPRPIIGTTTLFAPKPPAAAPSPSPAPAPQTAAPPAPQPAPTPAPAPVPPPPPPTAQGATTKAFTGNETPYQVLPTQSQGLQDILSRLQTEAGRQLDQPTVYDDALFKEISDSQKAGINENFDAAQRSLAAELASRGINYSSIAGGKLNDISTARARALSDVDTQNARDRAMALAQGRSAAFNNASGIAGALSNLEQGNREELRTERGYADNLRDAARNQSLQELLLNEQLGSERNSEFQDLLRTALGYGQGGAAGSMLGAAGSLLGSTASQYAGREQSTDAGLSQLAQLAAQLFGGGSSQ